MAELTIAARTSQSAPGETEILHPSRVVIENIQPAIDAGKFPIKRVLGGSVSVTADIHADGHDLLAAVLRHRMSEETAWQETRMTPAPNDVWAAHFSVNRLGRYEFTVQAWLDSFATWRFKLSRKLEAGQNISNDLIEGASLVHSAGQRAKSQDATDLKRWAEVLRSNQPADFRYEVAMGDTLNTLMQRYDARPQLVTYDQVFQVEVDRLEARYGAWYEMFPRSAGKDTTRSATLRQAESRLSDIAAQGFSVLYLPPIHPIGRNARKGPNNSLDPKPEDPGSPWAIGSAEGGHKDIDKSLGTFSDFDHFLAAANARGLEVALDLAFQCSPDHPYIHAHPEWFRHRPDGTIQHAENPPKIYEDIVPFDFDCEEWQSLWQELKSIVIFWLERGIRIFRVDNPHTKPYPFWEWLIRETKRDYPDTLFLAEAFTRPKILKYLAKCGFSQSYTYFTWRNTKSELTAYFSELTQPPVADMLRPNLFINTPDILPQFLQFGGRPAFLIRLFLAATLGASYGMYGPPFEVCEARALPDSEDYQDSEKFQIRVWDLEKPGHIREWIKLMNRIRDRQPALHANDRLRFYPVANEALLCYAKTTPDFSNVILVVINLDPHHVQDGWLSLTLSELGIEDGHAFQVHDLLSDARYEWHGASNYVRLDPAVCPAHIFQVLRRSRTEKEFDYYG